MDWPTVSVRFEMLDADTAGSFPLFFFWRYLVIRCNYKAGGWAEGAENRQFRLQISFELRRSSLVEIVTRGTGRLISLR